MVLISFDNYKGSTIANLEDERVVPITPIRHTWNSKSRTLCLCLQIPVHLVWAIMIHKSQGLTLRRAIIDLDDKEFSASLSFVAMSRVRALEDLLFKPFNFDRLQHIKDCKRLKKKLDEKKRFIFMTLENRM